ncbi:hypothetical protein ACFVVM_20170 [Nocardia sp. NPDC058176]|uniref:hypothetical protein n=1 Tax=Nocardia sp. NPDC058176 TaxID=3346368 RepID=UPI0036D891D0
MNRQPDFAWIDGFWAGGGSARVGVCTGLPGVGKTAFVRRCVERVRDAGLFADGDLHVDFGPADGERTSVADALAACLTALGVSADLIPPTLAARANRLRTLTAHKSVLIVLENVSEPAQVRPFVPNSASSAVLVASNSPLSELSLDGAEVRRLAPLTGAAGAHLLAEWIGARAEVEPAAVADLVQLCGGLPVALKIVAKQLAARPARSVESVVAAITADETGLAPFAVAGRESPFAVFSQAYAAFAEDDPDHERADDTARLYRLLGLYPGHDLTRDTVAVLFGRDAARANRAADALIDAGLLDEDSAERLSLHPLLRRHAATLADKLDSDVERADALRRVTEYLLVQAAFADLALLGDKRFRCTPAAVTAGFGHPFTGADAKRSALDWLDGERRNLLAVQRVAAVRGWHDSSWQLAEALSALYVSRRYYVDWTTSSEIGATSARLAGDVRAEARLRSFVSRAWTELGRLDRAREELLGQALPLAESTGDRRLLASVWEFVARYREAAEPDGAQEAYQRSVDLFERENDARGVAFVRFFAAKARLSAGDPARAEIEMRAALPLIRAVGEARMLGRCLTELGRMLIEDESAEARVLLTEAAEVLDAGGHTFYEAQAQEQLAHVAERSGDIAARRAALTRLVQLHRDLGSDCVDQFTAALDQLPDPA